ncbi:MAG: hypothetical protein GY856_24000 [bacterium]|nr:hypothetical protein [bacterium]
MASQSLQALFLRVRDQYERSSRFSGLAVVALLFFHVTVVAPFVELSRRQAAASSQFERLRRIEAETNALRPAIAKLGDHAREAMEPALGQLIEGLRGDLLRLAATRRALRDLIAERDATAGDRADSSSQDDGDAAEPSPEEDPLAGVLPFEVDDPDRSVAIGEAETREELLAALDPLVDEAIVRPRFATLNQLWTATVLPQVEAGLDGVAAEIPQLHGRFPEADAEWDELANALGGFRRAARDLVFKPPERPHWWAPAPGEEELAPRPQPAVEEQLREPLVLDELAVTGDRALTRFEALAERMARHREALPSPQQDAAGLSAVLDRLGLSRQMVAGLFPLILGVLLAGLVVAHTRRLDELGWMIHLLLAAGEPPGLRTWFLIRQQWGLGTGTGRIWRRVLVRGVPALAWVVVAGAQLAGVEGFAKHRVLAATAAGAAVLTIALVRELTVSRSTLAFVFLVDEDPAPDFAPPAADGNDDEVIDGHPLKH